MALQSADTDCARRSGKCRLDGRIQVFGGEGNSGTPEGTFSANEEYDPAGDTWRNLARMPTPRHGLYGITVGRGVFVPGGGPRAGAFYTNAHEAFFLPPAREPQIGDGGIVNAAGGHPVITGGSLVSLYGAGLAPAEQAAPRSSPLPKQMSAVSVSVNGNPVPLLFVSPQQINFLLPFETQGAPSIIVNYAGKESRPALLRPENLRVDSAPAIFTISAETQAAALIAGTGLIAGPPLDMVSRPAHRGEVVEIYRTGLGAVSNPPPDGIPASDALSRTLGTTIVMIGNTRAEVLFSGLAPGLAGVYQVNARIPEGAPTGERVPLSIQVNEAGLVSNRATIAFR